jgi:hypothetical protein
MVAGHPTAVLARKFFKKSSTFGRARPFPGRAGLVAGRLSVSIETRGA